MGWRKVCIVDESASNERTGDRQTVSRATGATGAIGVTGVIASGC